MLDLAPKSVKIIGKYNGNIIITSWVSPPFKDGLLAFDEIGEMQKVALAKMANFGMKLAILPSAAMAYALAMSSSAGAEPINPAAIAGTCVLCHAAKASAPLDDPKRASWSPLSADQPGAIATLDGKTASAIEEAMRQFKSGERAATVMDRIAKGYSDEDIAAVARHFGQTEP
jgi:cytochrome c553